MEVRVALYVTVAVPERGLIGLYLRSKLLEAVFAVGAEVVCNYVADNLNAVLVSCGTKAFKLFGCTYPAFLGYAEAYGLVELPPLT